MTRKLASGAGLTRGEIVRRQDPEELGASGLPMVRRVNFRLPEASTSGTGCSVRVRFKTLICDAHEWINEIPTVPTYYLAKPQPRERAWHN